ncbi:YeeE/YedE family protein [Pararhizobium haloflavum]|uniref:YeeE/YedE family protein n=1 Tax=Pararhizobium haloflavum TaxID=2037914 RepID=UPI000C189ED5|nr:YeeE/YedE family protein [Pararhizobium haloflavum]
MDSFLWLPLAGLAAGLLLGYTARRAHFCTLSALERHWYAGDSRGLRTWVLSAALAIVFTQSLASAGAVDLSQSFYLSPSFGWLGAIAGGLMFGLGMSLVGTCGFGALIRLGGGSLRGLIVLIVIALTGLVTQRGVIAPLRQIMESTATIDFTRAGSQSIGAIATAATGIELGAAASILTVLALVLWVFTDADYRVHRSGIAAAVAIALAIAFGWLATSIAADHSFYPVQVESASFVTPVADLVMLFGIHTGGGFPDYGVGVVFGTVLGAAFAAWRSNDMRWEACDDARELGRHLGGAALMGIGGVFALGCTIGQGISAMSTLAVSAPIVMVSIGAGARLGLAHLIEGSALAAFGRPAG